MTSSATQRNIALIQSTDEQSTGPNPPLGQTTLPRLFAIALACYAGLLLVGLVAGLCMRASPTAQQAPGPSGNIFTYLFAFNEPVPCALHLLSIAVMLRWLQLGAPLPTWLRRPQAQHRQFVFLMGLVAFAIPAIGTFAVFHNYPFSMDEYMADFQAKIFAAGKVSAEVPEQWREFEPWMRSIFTVYDPKDHTWTSPYLPVYGALRTLPMLIGVEWSLNPLLASISILAVAGVARQLWPQDPLKSVLAAALLLSSSQFLITSMTAYSMPAHLCFNLLWLWLFTSTGSKGKLIAPWLGLLAVGLHQPNVHLLFALPFGLRFLRERQWRWAAYYLLMYVFALVVWNQWWAIVRPGALQQSGALMAWPGAKQLMVQLMNTVLVASWQNVLFGVLALFAVRSWKVLPRTVQDMALGCCLTFGAYLLFNSDQGHGWGYRYFYSVLGNLVLLAVAGWDSFEKSVGASTAKRFAGCSIAFALLLLLPLRAYQAETVVRPFATADTAIQSTRADVVLIPIFSAWYAQDLLRNAPFLQSSPKVLRSYGLSQARISLLHERNSVLLLTPEALTRMGLTTNKLSTP